MSAQILDGVSTSKEIRSKIKASVEKRVENGLRSPGLAVVLVGDDPASRVYVSKKREACTDVGEPDSIAMKGRQLMEEIGSEYSFKSSFNKCHVIGAIVLYSDIWRDIAFYIVITV